MFRNSHRFTNITMTVVTGRIPPSARRLRHIQTVLASSTIRLTRVPVRIVQPWSRCLPPPHPFPPSVWSAHPEPPWNVCIYNQYSHVDQATSVYSSAVIPMSPTSTPLPVLCLTLPSSNCTLECIYIINIVRFTRTPVCIIQPWSRCLPSPHPFPSSLCSSDPVSWNVNAKSFGYFNW